MASLTRNRASAATEIRRTWPRWLAVGLGVLLLALYGSLIGWASITRYSAYNAGMFDLGNMAQAISSVQRGEPLEFTYRTGSMSRLALHVELIYFLLAVPYALWSDPRLLLAIQAGLFALGVLPIYRMALRHSNSWIVAACLAAVYLLYPTALGAVLFDLHGDTLAMPLLLFALDALDRRAWRAYALFIALALSCKFYVAVPVALLGLLVWHCYGERRAAYWTTGAALVYGLVAFFVVRPFFATPDTPDLHGGSNYLSVYFGEFRQIVASRNDRLLHAMVVFGPAAPLIWRGWRWLLPALPMAALALLSTSGGPSYAYYFHHYGTVVPFIMMAAIAGAKRPWPSHPYAGRLLGAIALMVTLFFNRWYADVPLHPEIWSGPLAQRRAYGVSIRDRVKDRFLAQHIPDGAPLATSLFLAPHLVNRQSLFLLRYPGLPEDYSLKPILPRVQYVLADALFDHPATGKTTYEWRQIRQLLRDSAFALVAARDGLLVFQRDAPRTHQLEQRIDVSATELRQAPPWKVFGPEIGLVDAQLTPLGGRRFQATFSWVAHGPARPTGHYIAVSRLVGARGARVVHLPTLALLPTSEWRPGQLIRESFQVEFPAELTPGDYVWRTGWYDPRDPASYRGHPSSLLPGSGEVSIGRIQLK